MLAARVMHHPMFERFIILLILISSVALAIDNPLGDPSSGWAPAQRLLLKTVHY